MKKDIIIKVEGLSKVYKLYNSPVDRLKEALLPGKRVLHKDFFALKDITFSVGAGEVVGLVGKNGVGKSTLLQIITGVLTPSSGLVEVKGQVSALLELGAGFNPELSGLENVYFKSSLLGNSRDDTDQKIDEILSFADIGEFIHQPVKNYSSGMYARLAFAVAISVDPDILIIDETLAVGDFRFKQKCLRKINDFREKNKTILFVSHDHSAVVQFCTHAIWLVDGRIHKSGEPAEICKEYLASMSVERSPDAEMTNATCKLRNKPGGLKNISQIEWNDVLGCEYFGIGGAFIKKVSLYLKGSGRRLDMFEGGRRVVFALQIEVKEKLCNPIVGFHVSDVKGIKIFGMNTFALQVDLGVFDEGEVKIVEFEFDFPYLKNGNYSFSPAVADGTQQNNVQHHWVHDAYIVTIASPDPLADLGNYFVVKENVIVRTGGKTIGV